MSDIICFTISTNYDDLLNIILPQNYKFFKKWYIVTHKDDTRTIECINKHNKDNIEILYFDFYANNKKFNKGGALRFAQNIAYDMYPNNPMLVLDSDIYLPDNFMELYSSINIDNDILYSTEIRYDYRSLIDFEYDLKKKIYPGSSEGYGFFQLYKINSINHSKYIYNTSEHCGECDTIFKNLFKLIVPIKGLKVKHLGYATTYNRNWEGRTNRMDFII